MFVFQSWSGHRDSITESQNPVIMQEAGGEAVLLISHYTTILQTK